ncbi:MAG: thymidine phosphorylase family protein [Bacteroidota bacterium]|uniref:thymidine phosphorylase family protein n=1 Tax=Croceimicrobium sp. TaxID=2828340 RepID=UPI0029C28397|nr:thymidine phosphorylase family protein [Bacteroidota bacterium]MDX5448257.1 thymidine phosphorylase family protein [Bacteroidota bacterium]MDX5506423.1 thymidine phosphorylase family protein [Bacteroidota bacterium]
MNELNRELKLRPLGIDTRNEHTVYMRRDCPVCVSEGFEALTRILVSHGSRSIVASLNVLDNENLLSHEEASLTEKAIAALRVKPGDLLTFSHLPPINSMSAVRSKVYGHRLKEEQIREIVDDLAVGNYSNVEIAAFVTACAGKRLDIDEIIHLTQSMVDAGQRLHWPATQVYDKHCIGGLPGNRTTPIVIAITAAAGLTIPKTSSRAITSPAGTADTMEVFTNVNLSLDQMTEVVKQENGCLAWGGSMQLSPADDILIRVEKALDIDSEGQMIASVLSKKVAAGSTHVVIDIPVGTTAKVRTSEDAEELSRRMTMVAEAIGLKLRIVVTDGSQPVGRGIGPALEARDVLAVLRNDPSAPEDLRNRALVLAGELLELSGIARSGNGNKKARQILDTGQAFKKFKAICEAQGRFDKPRLAKYQYKIKAEQSGTVMRIDNRKLAKVAKLAGAPNDKLSGVDFLTPVGTPVVKGGTLYVIHAESKGELNYALEYNNSQKDILTIQ